MPAFSPSLTEPLPLRAHGSWPESNHLFDEDSVMAVQAALAATRPLLVRGEPGLGKSQLARAVAQELKVPFLSYVVHARSEPDDILFGYDAVSRLARAQIMRALPCAGGEANGEAEKALKDELAEVKFVRPRPLWWALDWLDAGQQNQSCAHPIPPVTPPGNWSQSVAGSVLLIDEIDKADSDFANALLEGLGNLAFEIPLLGKAVRVPPGSKPPLVVITTNEDRELPAPFLRRCFVLQMQFGRAGHKLEASKSLEELEQDKQWLLARARAHFQVAQIRDDVCLEAAGLLLADRKQAELSQTAIPGAAEFLDLLKALFELHGADANRHRTAMLELKKFVFCKNPIGKT